MKKFLWHDRMHTFGSMLIYRVNLTSSVKLSLWQAEVSLKHFENPSVSVIFLFSNKEEIGYKVTTLFFSSSSTAWVKCSWSFMLSFLFLQCKADWSNCVIKVMGQMIKRLCRQTISCHNYGEITIIKKKKSSFFISDTQSNLWTHLTKVVFLCLN